jgi:2-polyprenyl-3-methyl-5-hydroxy-6-metoxy-1,4-benzoquinol methylase
MRKDPFQVTDHSVSGETFNLVYNASLHMWATHPQPSKNEMGRYYNSEAYISHTDGKRTVFERAYQIVRWFTLKHKLKLINQYATSSKRLLDIGCGTGDFLKAAVSANWNVTGIEPNEKARVIARAKVKNDIFKPSHLNDLEHHTFDVITLWHVLEHVPDLDNYITQLKQLLHPNGVIVVAVPNYNSYDAKYYKQYWAAYDVPRHLWHFSKQSINLLGKAHGLNIIKILPMYFDAYYVSLLSEKYKRGHMNILNALRVGFVSNLKSIYTKECSSHIHVLKLNK